MKVSTKKRNPLLKGQLVYLSRSKSETIGLVAAEPDGEAAWETLRHAELLLAQFSFRTVRHTFSGAPTAEDVTAFLAASGERPLRAVIVASRGAALPGFLTAQLHGVPVIRIPLPSGGESPPERLAALEPLAATAPPAEEGSGAFATVAIGEAGAKNAALLVVALEAASGDRQMRGALNSFRNRQTAAVLASELPRAGNSDLSRAVRR